MRTLAMWTALMVACWKEPWAAGVRYMDESVPGTGRLEGYGALAEVGGRSDKRVELSEPSCEELRAMWRYTKRQSRAANTNTGYPLYTDPFAYNMWPPYTERPKPAHNYRAKFANRARSRAAGGAPIYGRMVHKAPAGSRMRNGMRHRTKAFDDLTRLYGTVNRYPASNRNRLTSFRVGGGISSPVSQVPQAGSFEHLKELIRAERARELQEQHMVDEASNKTNGFEEDADRDEIGERRRLMQSRKQFLNPTLQVPPKVNYGFDNERYLSSVPNMGQAWSRSDPQPREYMFG